MVLPSIPVIDVREGGPVELAARHRDALDRLRRLCFGSLPAPVRPLLPVADKLARDWLARNRSPYAGEVAAIAGLLGAPGAYLLNTSYEWACTTACISAGDGAPALLRTLDWRFAGLGREMVVACQDGAAGPFWSVTWPGAVGVLSALAPGRFAATINLGPLYRRWSAGLLRELDRGLNALRTLRRVSHPPPAHVLRQVFEQAVDFAQARDLLLRTPMARPALIALAGVNSGETCLIEREAEVARLRDGPVVLANDWQVPLPHWEARFCHGTGPADSAARRKALLAAITPHAAPFDWLAPPVHNWETRLALEMAPRDGSLRLVGFEPVHPGVPSVQATAILDLSLRPPVP